MFIGQWRAKLLWMDTLLLLDRNSNISVSYRRKHRRQPRTSVQYKVWYFVSWFKLEYTIKLTKQSSIGIVKRVSFHVIALYANQKLPL